MAASPDIAPAPIGIPNRPAASASGGLGSLSSSSAAASATMASRNRLARASSTGASASRCSSAHSVRPMVRSGAPNVAVSPVSATTRVWAARTSSASWEWSSGETAGSAGSPSRAAGSAVRRASSQFTGPSDWSIRMTSLRSIFDMSKIDLNEVMRMLQSDGPVNWELARRTALPAALEGEPSPPEADAAGLFGMPMGAGAMSGLAAMLAPVLLGVQAGSMVGYLARHALGRYDLPLPTSDPPNLCFVVANLDRFEAA